MVEVAALAPRDIGEMDGRGGGGGGGATTGAAGLFGALAASWPGSALPPRGRSPSRSPNPSPPVSFDLQQPQQQGQGLARQASTVSAGSGASQSLDPAAIAAQHAVEATANAAALQQQLESVGFNVPRGGNGNGGGGAAGGAGGGAAGAGSTGADAAAGPAYVTLPPGSAFDINGGGSGSLFASGAAPPAILNYGGGASASAPCAPAAAVAAAEAAAAAAAAAAALAAPDAAAAPSSAAAAAVLNINVCSAALAALAPRAADLGALNDEFSAVLDADDAGGCADAGCLDGSAHANAAKNRYANVLPYDANRVPLPKATGRGAAAGPAAAAEAAAAAAADAAAAAAAALAAGGAAAAAAAASAAPPRSRRLVFADALPPGRGGDYFNGSFIRVREGGREGGGDGRERAISRGGGRFGWRDHNGDPTLLLYLDDDDAALNARPTHTPSRHLRANNQTQDPAVDARYACGYVATQGPLPATVGDFWRAVRVARCSAVVMLTNYVDFGRAK